MMALTYEPIASTTLSTATSTVTFSSIPATYSDLRISFNGIFGSAGTLLTMRVNNISTGSYGSQYIYGDGSGLNSTRTSTYTYLELGGAIFGADSDPYSAQIDIVDYTDTSYIKTALAMVNNDKNGTGEITFIAGYLGATYSAINRLDFLPGAGNFNAGTIITVYGIKRA